MNKLDLKLMQYGYPLITCYGGILFLEESTKKLLLEYEEAKEKYKTEPIIFPW